MKQTYLLTDGNEVFGVAYFTPAEWRKATEAAERATAGNIQYLPHKDQQRFALAVDGRDPCQPLTMLTLADFLHWERRIKEIDPTALTEAWVCLPEAAEAQV